MLSLLNSVDNSYKSINKPVLVAKSVIISACSNIDRHLYKYMSYELGNSLTQEQLPQFLNLYPNLRILTLKQINDLLTTVNIIRAVNAHVFLRKEIYLSTDIKKVLMDLYKPQYLVTTEGRKLTMYGMFYVLLFLSHKYTLLHFVTDYMSVDIFKEIPHRGEKRTYLHRCIQLDAGKVCGIGKPIEDMKVNSPIIKNLSFINDLNKRYLTRVFFSLEMASNANKKEVYNVNAPSLAAILGNNQLFVNNQSIMDDLVVLRNTWFHGNWLYDKVDWNGTEILLTLDFVIRILKNLKSLIDNYPEYKAVIKDINEYGLALIYYFAMRFVEVSYKLLDKRLLKEDKVDSRISDASSAYYRLLSAKEDYYTQALSLLKKPIIYWDIHHSKFTDFIHRQTVRENLHLFHLHSDNGFEIGNYKTGVKDLYIADIDLELCFQNKINGKYFKEYVEYNSVQFTPLFTLSDLK